MNEPTAERRCPRTFKTAFASKREALAKADEIRSLRLKGSLKKHPPRLSAYDCPFCPYWHLTGSPFRPRQPVKAPPKGWQPA